MTLNTDVELHPVGGEPISLADQTQMFHLVAVVIDPYTHESSWILPTAARILAELREADCRVAWLVTAQQDDALTFLGPWADDVLVLCDPEREAVAALGLEQIPALVVVGTNQELVGVAQGWDPNTWRPVTDSLAKVLSWKRPAYSRPRDPVAFAGTPAMG